jgi:predicted permease
VEIPGYTPAENEPMSLDLNIVSPGYFEAMGIPLLRGRGFTVRDDSTAPPVVVINERFAQRFWKDGDAIGKRVRNGGREWTVVGVVPTGKYRRLGEDPLAYIYYPHLQRWQGSMTLHIRTRGDPTAIVPVLRREVAALDADLPLSNVRTMTDFLGTALLPARLAGVVLGVFGLLGLGLACVGIYGVMSYSVAQRTREIGIRMAIGAAHGQVIRLIVRQGMTLVLIGAAIGIGAALAVSQLVRSLLYGGSALDPVAFGVVPIVLVGVALIATLIPARRAARVQPVRALKSE